VFRLSAVVHFLRSGSANSFAAPQAELEEGALERELEEAAELVCVDNLL
jgi:hypothetical protein